MAAEKQQTWRNADTIANKVLNHIFEVANDYSLTPSEKIRTIKIIAADQSNEEHMRALTWA